VTNVDGPSEHLSWEELACRDGTPYPHEWRSTRAAALAKLFELVREEAGGYPLYVLSGYRTREYNARLRNAATRSEHVEGRALDIARPVEIPAYGEFVAAVFRVRERSNDLMGIGVYPSRNSVHVDVREKEWLALWTG